MVEKSDGHRNQEESEDGEEEECVLAQAPLAAGIRTITSIRYSETKAEFCLDK